MFISSTGYFQAKPSDDLHAATPVLTAFNWLMRYLASCISCGTLRDPSGCFWRYFEGEHGVFVNQ